VGCRDHRLGGTTEEEVGRLGHRHPAFKFTPSSREQSFFLSVMEAADASGVDMCGIIEGGSQCCRTDTLCRQCFVTRNQGVVL